MAITKIQSESMNLADTYAFTGTVTGAGESNSPYFRATQNSGQSISNETTTLINYDTVGYNIGCLLYTSPSPRD